MKFLSQALVVFLGASSALGDLYVHNPRGSNDRLNEANVNRDNGNRVFDSQNNGKGGYCVGPAMNYYEDSVTTIEWTNQHACGLRVNTDCNLVFQYMCTTTDAPAAQRVRDGTTTGTINANANGAQDLTKGMHESYASYQECENRERNQGLFIADRNLNGDDARFTRQNNNGNRNGLECPEERDYYPYWGPSEWKDIAVLTSDTSICPYFQAESQNVKDRAKCVGATGDEQPITQEACTAQQGTWTVVPSHFGAIPEDQLPYERKVPQCAQAPFSRDNHLGNGVNGKANQLEWTMPNAAMEPCVATGNCACAFRMRYNISTTDYDAWGTYNPATGQMEGFLTSLYNGANSPVEQDPDVPTEGATGYPLAEGGTSTNQSLALNTNQYGRTFQDRSFVFELSLAPADLQGEKIVNINVRGKRGNIVQTYPSVEYDFVPTEAQVPKGTYVHFQWTGCDTNPAGNAGEGTAGTDRSNVIPLPNQAANMPAYSTPSEATIGGYSFQKLTEDAATLNTLMYANSGVTTPQAQAAGETNNVCKGQAALLAQNNNNQNQVEQDEQNCQKLNNDASKYVNTKPIVLENAATYPYMSTRNNNFTNRSQKASITVTEGALPTWGVALAAVGAVVVVAGLAVAGLFAFARTHPHSAVANMFSRS